MSTRDNVLGVLDHPGVVNSALIAGGRRARPGVMGSVPVDDRSKPGEQQQQQQPGDGGVRPSHGQRPRSLRHRQRTD